MIESVISICSREVGMVNDTLSTSPGDVRHDFETISFGDVLALLGPSAFPVRFTRCSMLWSDACQVLFLLLSLPSALGML